MTYFLCFIILLLSIGIVLACYHLLRLARIIFRFEEEIEASIDTLGECTQRINIAMKRSYLFDDPTVLATFQEIHYARKELASIQQRLAKIGEKPPVETKKELQA